MLFSVSIQTVTFSSGPYRERAVELVSQGRSNSSHIAGGHCGLRVLIRIVKFS